MGRLHRPILILTAVVFVVSLVLLLNFTAPNPTGRRYSSEIVLIAGNSQDIGLSAEQVLSRDLGVPRNDDPAQRQCICSSSQGNGTVPSDCRSCVTYSPLIADHRRPDFITAYYIAEAKNRQNLLYTYSDQVEQIADYAEAARALNVPLWLFTRVDTTLSPEYHGIVEATGGRIVPYFTVPGHIDPVDTIAHIGLVGALTALVVVLALKRITRLPRKTPTAPKNPMDAAGKKAKNAEDFLNSAKDRLRSQIDIEDSRDDLR